ncbi:MAG: hypothetical protein ABIE07_07165 [Candidatus Zixiibacteriota bacterium]
MKSENINNELIGKYLSGKMEPSEKATFEKDVENNSQLQKEVNKLAGLKVGLDIVDRVDSGHPNIELLVQYQENPMSLDKNAIGKIESHLKTCPECSEEIRLCSHIRLESPEPISYPTESILDKIKKFIFVPSFRLQPAVALALLIILAIPAIYGVKSYLTPDITSLTYQIKPGTRSAQDNNIITIGDDNKLIRFEFGPAVTDDCQNCLYDFEFYDPSGLLRTINKSNTYQKDFAFELTDDYFSSKGYYTLEIIEIAEDGNREIIEVYQIFIRLDE